MPVFGIYIFHIDPFRKEITSSISLCSSLHMITGVSLVLRSIVCLQLDPMQTHVKVEGPKPSLVAMKPWSYRPLFLPFSRTWAQANYLGRPSQTGSSCAHYRGPGLLIIPGCSLGERITSMGLNMLSLSGPQLPFGISG